MSPPLSKVLLIEDDRTEADLISGVLASTAYRDSRIEHVQRLQAGVDRLAAEHYDETVRSVIALTSLTSAWRATMV